MMGEKGKAAAGTAAQKLEATKQAEDLATEARPY